MKYFSTCIVALSIRQHTFAIKYEKKKKIRDVNLKLGQTQKENNENC